MLIYIDIYFEEKYSFLGNGNFDSGITQYLFISCYTAVCLK